VRYGLLRSGSDAARQIEGKGGMRLRVATIAISMGGAFAGGQVAHATEGHAAEGIVAEEAVPAVPDSRPWGLSAEMSFHDRHQPSYASAGLGVERSANRYLAFDASFAKGLPSTVETTNGDAHLEPAFEVSARARGKLPLDGRAIHSLFIAAGPELAFGGVYDSLWRGQVEAGYALRAPGGFSFLYAIGTEVALSSRTAPLAPETCVAACPQGVKMGDLSLVVRAGLGYSF
jgi:hypothetical protein